MTPVKGVIESFRRGPRTQRNNQLIIWLPDVDREEIDKLIGRKVVVKDKYGNEYRGYVKKRHGNNSKVLVEFEKGLPGNILGGDALIE